MMILELKKIKSVVVPPKFGQCTTCTYMCGSPACAPTDFSDSIA